LEEINQKIDILDEQNKQLLQDVNNHRVSSLKQLSTDVLPTDETFKLQLQRGNPDITEDELSDLMNTIRYDIIPNKNNRGGNNRTKTNNRTKPNNRAKKNKRTKKNKRIRIRK
jgi:hypothetical protein